LSSSDWKAGLVRNCLNLDIFWYLLYYH